MSSAAKTSGSVQKRGRTDSPKPTGQKDGKAKVDEKQSSKSKTAAQPQPQKSSEPEAQSVTYAEGVLYVSAGIILLTTFLVPYVPGTVEFFGLQAFVWGLASYLFCYARKLSWLRAGLPKGPPWIEHWEESAPAWAFEASFWVESVNIIFALGMAPAVLASRDVLWKSFTLHIDDYEPSGMWLDHVIFASLFGFMLRDFVLFYATPDPLLAVHHVGVLVLMVSFGFAAIPGVRLLAFITPVVEIGTCFYCAFSVWRWSTVYWWVMNLSNVVMFLGTSGIFFFCTAWTSTIVICYAIGVALAVVRTAVMVDLLRKHGFWGAPATSKASKQN